MSDESTAQRLGRELREGSKVEARGAQHDAELARLMRSVHALRSRSPSRARRWLAMSAAAAALLLAALGAGVFASRRDLTYDVRGAARVEARSVSAESGEPVQIRFSDGSTFELSPGTLLRVEGTTPDGARLLLLDGETTAHVVHRARSRFSVSAGPFEVVVVGTRFDTRWDADARRLSVELREGAVEVRGGRLGEPVVLRAGQRLEAGTSPGDWRITPLSSQAAEPAQPAAPASEEKAIERAVEPPSEPLKRALSWPALMSRSDFATIVEEAEAMGTERCFASCSPKNLRILADAARYTGRFELAEKSLLALRRRSPAQAAAALFFLARLYELRGQSAESLRLYRQHLVEAPRGDYAEEASAGRMRMLVRTRDVQGAREAAQSYLRDYPGGVHEASARRVLERVTTP